MRFLCIVQCKYISFISILRSIPLFKLLQFICSVDGHLVCFQFLTIMKSTALNISRDEKVVYISGGYIRRRVVTGS